MIANFKKLVDQHDNTYHGSINKKPVNADFSVLSENIESNNID